MNNPGFRCIVHVPYIWTKSMGDRPLLVLVCTSTLAWAAALHKHRLRNQIVCACRAADGRLPRRPGDHQPHRTAYEYIGTVPARPHPSANSWCWLERPAATSSRAQTALGRHCLHRIPRACAAIDRLLSVQAIAPSFDHQIPPCFVANRL